MADTSAAKVVAICGATGQQGGATLKSLLKLNSEKKRFSIRALTRDPSSSKAKALLNLEPKGNIELYEANFDNPETLTTAFQGCDAVFAVTDFWKGANMDPLKELEQGKHLVDAAKKTGIKHFVFSSLEDTRPIISDLVEPVNGNYTVPHFDAKAEIDQYAWKKLPLKSWTSLFPSIFYENLVAGTGTMAPQKQDDGTFLLSLPTNGYHMAWCTAEDIGGVAATVIDQGSEVWGHKLLGIVGEYATLEQVAATISKVTGKRVTARTPSVEEWLKESVSAGMPELVVKDLANMFVYYTKGNKGFLCLRTLQETFGAYPDVQNLESWVEKNKELFLKGMGEERARKEE